MTLLPMEAEYHSGLSTVDYAFIAEETGHSQLAAEVYMNARTLRLADGPDEVHRMVVAGAELRPWIKRTKK